MSEEETDLMTMIKETRKEIGELKTTHATKADLEDLRAKLNAMVDQLVKKQEPPKPQETPKSPEPPKKKKDVIDDIFG